MPLALVISSYVAASRVGGGIAPYALAPVKVDPVLVPTTLFGRHPGWGAPGGAAVAAGTMQAMLDGVAANGLFALTDAIVTGYFATPEQVEVAARAIDAVRASGRAAFVMVDPVMGDTGRGLFVPEETAQAQAELLVPRANLVACNHWEFQRLTGPAPGIADVISQAGSSVRNWLVGSVPHGDGIGNVLIEDGAVHAVGSERVPDPTPKGTGDLFRLVFLGQRLTGATPAQALRRAVGAVEAILRKAREWQAPELPLAATQTFLANPPEGGEAVTL